MKKILYLLIPFFIIPGKSISQDNAIKISPVPLILGNIRLTYERALTDRSSIQLQTGFQIPRSLPALITNDFEDFDLGVKLRGFNLALDYRIYRKRSVLDGGYFAPFVLLNQMKSTYSGTTNGFDEDIGFIYRYYGLGIVFGKQWLFGNNITLDTFGGFGGINNTVIGFYETEDPEFDINATEEDIQEATNISFITNNLDIDIFDDRIEAKTHFFLPTVRLGFSLGFAF